LSFIYVRTGEKEPVVIIDFSHNLHYYCQYYFFYLNDGLFEEYFDSYLCAKVLAIPLKISISFYPNGSWYYDWCTIGCKTCTNGSLRDTLLLLTVLGRFILYDFFRN